MRTIAMLLLVVIILMLSVGCGKINPIVSEDDIIVPEVGTATANISVVLEAAATLKKSASWDSPTYLLIEITPSVHPGYTYDTVWITSGQLSVQASIPGFKRGDTYSVAVGGYSEECGIVLNSGYLLNFVVPDSSSFILSLTAGSTAQKLLGNFVLKGTVAASTAIGFKFCASTNSVGTPYSECGEELSFPVGTMDTVKIQRMIPLRPASQGVSDYTFSVEIPNADGSQWKGSASIAITPGVNSSLVVPLVLFGGVSSLGKMTITLSPNGETEIGISFP